MRDNGMLVGGAAPERTAALRWPVIGSRMLNAFCMTRVLNLLLSSSSFFCFSAWPRRRRFYFLQDDPGAVNAARGTRPIRGAFRLRISSLYWWRSRKGTMAINPRVISGPDPGAVPGGSTRFLPGRWPDCLGPTQDRRTCKGEDFARLGPDRSPLQ